MGHTVISLFAKATSTSHDRVPEGRLVSTATRCARKVFAWACSPAAEMAKQFLHVKRTTRRVPKIPRRITILSALTEQLRNALAGSTRYSL